MTDAPAGWYPGPDGRLQWWDGQAWTPWSTPGTSVIQASADHPRVPDGTAVHTPWMWGIVAIAAAGLTVVFAYFDRAALQRRGFVRPFPWPWALLGIVYATGRSVVVWRQSGRGLSVVWVSGAIYVATILVSIGWGVWFSVWMTNEMTGQLTTRVP